MAISTRVIKQRIRSVKNTKKITKAMELVAASKMRRATASVSATRPFSQLAWETVRTISRKVDVSLHPLLSAQTEGQKTLYIVFTSDRGLCGGYNARLLKETFEDMSRREGDFDVVAVGRRAEAAMKRAKQNIVATFLNVTNNPAFAEIRPVALMAIEAFRKGEYARVVVAYTDYISALAQKPKVFTLLPLSSSEVEGLGEVHEGHSDLVEGSAHFSSSEYKFEPSPERVLDVMLPRIVETMIWQALLEAAASEHSARMLAMRSASDSAGEMIDDLTLTFNQARQAGITQEIAEISSGAAALA